MGLYDDVDGSLLSNEAATDFPALSVASTRNTNGRHSQIYVYDIPCLMLFSNIYIYISFLCHAFAIFV
jgi:hypothetical protein